jgi:CheY-like chemotaxis protein
MAYLLIVDDDPDFASSVATVCESMGHQVQTVHSTQQALLQLEQRRPDAVLLDVIFPEDASGGFQLAREIRRRFGIIPILMLTAVNQQFPLGFSDKDIDPKWLPVTDFLEKPVDFRLLRDKVTQLLNHHSQVPTG